MLVEEHGKDPRVETNRWHADGRFEYTLSLAKMLRPQMRWLQVFFLFDHGSTNSYVSPIFAKGFELDKIPVRLEGLFLLAILMGEALLVESS